MGLHFNLHSWFSFAFYDNYHNKAFLLLYCWEKSEKTFLTSLWSVRRWCGCIIRIRRSRSDGSSRWSLFSSYGKNRLWNYRWQSWQLYDLIKIVQTLPPVFPLRRKSNENSDLWSHISWRMPKKVASWMVKVSELRS